MYDGNIFDSDEIGEAVGFVYEIENTATGKLYIGKKIFMSAKKKVVAGKTKKFKVESDWKKYYGSNANIKQDALTMGKEKFTRRILRLCGSKSEMSYYEMKEIFERDALIQKHYYNDWVSCRINRRNLRAIFYERDVAQNSLASEPDRFDSEDFKYLSE